jgi:hypothetical protein
LNLDELYLDKLCEINDSSMERADIAIISQ